VLDRVEGPGFLRAAPGIGDVVPADVTAAGQLYDVFGSASAAPRGARESDEGRRVAERGYALNRDAWIDGLSVLGVPVWQLGGQGARELIGVMALAASSPRFERLGEADVAGSLLVAAERVGERLGAGILSRKDSPSRKARMEQEGVDR
jgi:DNA-binding IclR family transcriptional regulator